MNKFPLAIALLLAVPAAGQPGVNRALPDWLSGTWQMEQGSDWADEVWMKPRGGMMLGMGRAGFGPQVQLWQSLRIAVKADGKVSLYTQLRGGPPAEFPMVAVAAEAIEFANPSHDYPQRIRYWRQGQLLMAELSRLDGSDVQRWNYRPTDSGAPP